MTTEKIINRAGVTASRLAIMHSVPRSTVVWIGGQNYIIVINGEEIRINSNTIGIK